MSSDSELFPEEEEDVEDNNEWSTIWQEDTGVNPESMTATACISHGRERTHSVIEVTRPWEKTADATNTEKTKSTSGGITEKAAGVSEHQNGIERHQRKSSPSKNQDGSMVSRMLLNDNKAGMEGLDKEKINSIIYEASKGSRFYENELKKEEQVNRRIEEQKERLDSLTAQQIQQGNTEAERLLEELESGRDLTRTIVHVDMDMFYAAVEMRDCPELKNKPMAVGGSAMLCTSNYIARRFGVRAAMPGFIGKKLCPDLVIIKTNSDKYHAVSEEVRDIFKDYDPNFAPMSLDEAYLDFTEYLTRRQNLSAEKRTFAKRGPVEFCQCLAMLSQSKYDYCNSQINEAENTSDKESRSSSEIVDNTERKSEAQTSVDGEQFIKEENIDIPSDMYESEEPLNLTTVGKSKPADVAKTESLAEVCLQCQKRVCADVEWEEFGLSVEEAVREMRFRIEHRTQLTASAGIAPNTMLAKVCSDKNKPNGQYRISPTREAVLEFVQQLPIRKVGGVGKVSEKMLSALDIRMCPDILEKCGIICHLYSEISFHHYMRIAIGIGSTHVERDSDRKSMSVERTFREINKPAELYEKCQQLCESLSEDLKREGLVGKTVTLKFKTVKFDVKTRAKSLKFNTNETEQIFSMAKEILRTEIQVCAPDPLRLRLMGVRMSNFLNQTEKRDEKQKTVTDLFKIITEREERSISSVPTSTQSVASNLDNNVGFLKPPKRNGYASSEKHKVASNNGTLLQFMNSGRAHTESSVGARPSVGYQCPVCGHQIQCASLVALNKHIDQCLVRSHQFNIKKNRMNTNQERCEPCCTVGKNPVPDNAAVGSASYTQSSHCDNRIVCDMVEEQNMENSYKIAESAVPVSAAAGCDMMIPDPVSRSSAPLFVCPVCEKIQLAGDLTTFNIHVDDCLNRQTIQELLQKPDGTSLESGKRSLAHPNNQSRKRKLGSNSNNETSIQHFFKREKKS